MSNASVKTIRQRRAIVVPSCARHWGDAFEQQEEFGFSDFSNERLAAQGGYLAVVADGGEGMPLAGQAARIAVAAMMREHETGAASQPDIACQLRRALEHANQAVLALAKKAALPPGQVKATLVAAVIHSRYLYWVSIGDSRIYLFRENTLYQITRDPASARTLSQDMKQGRLDPITVAAHLERDALAGHLGKPELNEVVVNVRPFPLRHGDKVMLCSDGLYKSLMNGEIADAMKTISPRDVSQRLVDAAHERKHRCQGNITVVTMAYEGSSADRTAPVSSKKVPEEAGWIITKKLTE